VWLFLLLFGLPRAGAARLSYSPLWPASELDEPERAMPKAKDAPLARKPLSKKTARTSWPSELDVVEWKKAGRAVMAKLRSSKRAAAVDVESLANDILDEALSKWDRLATFSTYAVSLAPFRLTDATRLALARADHETQSSAQGDTAWTASEDEVDASRLLAGSRGPREAVVRLRAEARKRGVRSTSKPPIPAATTRMLHRFIETEARALEGMWPGADGPANGARYLETMIRVELLRAHSAELQACLSRESSEPLEMPATFVTQLEAYFRRVSDTGTGGWVEGHGKRPVARAGRSRRGEPSTPAYVWMGRRHDMLCAVVRRGLALCGLPSVDVNRILAPIDAAESRSRKKAVQILRRARLGLGK
jgi:hypothetical protein